MKNKAILSSFGFNIALVILLLNDFILKDLYGNWLTGKLSDFVGLFAFALFFIALFPKQKQLILAVIGLFFIFWKSPFSQPCIDFWNNLGVLNIARVVDYTDLFALLMLPLAGTYSKTLAKSPELKFIPILPILVACFAFVATSRVKNHGFMVEKLYTYALSRGTLITRMNNRLDSLNQGFIPDSLIEHSGKFHFFIRSDDYGVPIEVQVSIQEKGALQTEAKLIYLNIHQPVDEKYQKVIIEEVERKFFNQLKK